ncbi:hypothetical protein Zmor_013481 [Zophobas morio]|uniref:Sodium channel protein Nach n=1 Tax=Zophobas morio TaxID=2755281 RepID=A0AA38IDK7_9CUCU|nr:hypothetical protein Zmor_013481 [Zophobas morio]
MLTLKKRDENPVFTSFSHTPMYLSDVPFPAVTICSEIKIKQSEYNVTDYFGRFLMKNLTDEEKQRVLDVLLFCNRGLAPIEGSKDVAVTNHTVDLKTLDVIFGHAPLLKNVVEYTDPQLYFNHFSPTLTNFGICYSFNMLDKSELFTETTYIHKNHLVHPKIYHWNIDKNYDEIHNSAFPPRASEFAEFSLGLGTDTSEETRICNPFSGYKLILHHPAEFPTLTTRYIPLSLDTIYNIWIKPEVTITSENLENYEYHKRNCFYSPERRLKFFKVYTKHNCKIECVANNTLALCNCIPYYLPHEESTKICGWGQLKCVSNAKEQILRNSRSINSRKMLKQCNCLPLCTSITYSAEAHQVKYPENPYMAKPTDVYLSFQDEELQVMERQELFSNSDFWASCGGILGLFAGFSVISLAEIIYFVTIRWLGDLWPFGNGRCNDKRFLFF